MSSIFDVFKPTPTEPPTPPTAADVTTKSGGTVQDELNALAKKDENISDELKPSKRRMMDPSLTAAFDTDTMTTDVAAPTNAPNRFTIWVPGEHTELSLGGGNDKPDRSTDLGLRGHTDNHIHLSVQRMPDKTFVRLGRPSEELDSAWSHGSQRGYLMGTEGFAMHYSKLSQGVLSGEGNVVVQAPAPAAYVNLQATDGYAEMVGGRAATIASRKDVILRADSTVVPPATADGSIKSGEHFASETANTDWYATAPFWMGAADTVLTGISLLQNAVEAGRCVKEGASGWETGIGIGKAAIDLAKLGMGIYQGIDDISNATFAGKHRVNILSGGNAGISADWTANIYGRWGATVASVLGASVVGGTAGVTGFLSASVWGGFEASVTAVRVAKLESQKFKAIVSGKVSAELQSEGYVAVQADGTARLSSTKAGARVHGKAWAAMTAGGKEGYGILADADEVRMGRISSGEKLNERPLIEYGFRATEKVTSLSHGDAAVTATEGRLDLSASKAKGVNAVTLDNSGDLKISASKRVFLD